MPKTVLVTGGTGWIASWITIELLRRGYEIRTSVRSLDREAAVRKAERILAWKPRPVTGTIIDCAHSLVAVGALS
jgi:nucleoside-diphosphate-sugar epimerase